MNLESYKKELELKQNHVSNLKSEIETLKKIIEEKEKQEKEQYLPTIQKEYYIIRTECVEDEYRVSGFIVHNMNRYDEIQRQKGNYFSTKEEALKISKYVDAFLKAYHCWKKLENGKSFEQLTKLNNNRIYYENVGSFRIGAYSKSCFTTPLIFSSWDNAKEFLDYMGEDLKSLFLL